MTKKDVKPTKQDDKVEDNTTDQADAPRDAERKTSGFRRP